MSADALAQQYQDARAGLYWGIWDETPKSTARPSDENKKEWRVIWVGDINNKYMDIQWAATGL